jgi:hypothetical protein
MGEDGHRSFFYRSDVTDAPPPRPPVIEQPAPYQVSYGSISGTAAPGTRRLVVRVAGEVVKDVAVERRRFSLQVTLPSREVDVSVTAFDGRGGRARTTVAHVQGLPRVARPTVRAPHLDGDLARAVQRLAHTYPGTASAYVLDLTSGAGAAWNARAALPAASTLKLGIAVVVLARAEGVPAPDSRVGRLLRSMLIRSDNLAANDLERWDAGSTSAGSHLVNAMMRAIGLTDSDMYGGYERGAYDPPAPRGLSVRIPLRADDQPAWGIGKRTTAYDLGTLLRAVWLASGGKGPLRRTQPGLTAADARHLLYLLARVQDGGKLGRFVQATPGVTIMHKGGWLPYVRHDNGLVAWRGGIYLVTMLTYRRSGVGTQEDILAGRLAEAVLRQLRG